MDCGQIKELLDAYALGASDAGEVQTIEEHVADCVRCWDDLSGSQQTAALLALAVPLEQAPARVEQRILATAQRERSSIPRLDKERAGLWGWVRNPWPATAAAFGAVSLSAVAITGLLAMQVQDVRDENDDLQTQLVSTARDLQVQAEITDHQMDSQQTIFTVLADDSREEVDVEPESRVLSAKAFYTWSPERQSGFLFCEDMPALPPGKVYQLWFTAEGEAYALAPFVSGDGTCQVTMDLSSMHDKPGGIGVSIENAPGGAERPTGGWLLYAHMPD